MTRSFEKTAKPAEGYETDEEVKAANNNQRLDLLRYLANINRKSAKKTRSEITRQDNEETAEALMLHRETLTSLTALRNNGFDNPNHQFHERYLQALEDYRQTKKNLKDYGRWNRTFAN